MPYDYTGMELANARARKMRWTAKGRARVTHPDHGSVIVPHYSNFAAIENAAEFWKVDPIDILDAKVEWVPDTEGPVRRPREFYRKKERENEQTDEPV